MIDDFTQKRTETLDISVPMRFHIDAFITLGTLDLSSSLLLEKTALKRKLQNGPERSMRINLLPPLSLPYGAIDIRSERKMFSTKKYPDLYTRKLPYRLLMRRTSREATRWMKKNKRGILGSVLTLFILTTPTLFYVRYAVTDAYARLMTLSPSMTRIEMLETIHSARMGFERSYILFTPFSWIPEKHIKLAHAGIEWGRDITDALILIFETLPESWSGETRIKRADSILPQYRAEAKDIYLLSSLGIDTPTDYLERYRDTIEKAQNKLMSASEAYGRVQIDSEIGEKVQKAAELLSSVSKVMDFYLREETSIIKMLGGEEPQRYMVFNQNRDEIRANGGFPGSVIAFTLYKGNILDLRTDDIYYYDWNLYPYKEVPPPGLALLSNNYGLRDVNYYPDFRITLEKANDFVERSGDETLTTGIAFHQGVIEDILEKIWPVNLSVSGASFQFSHENFSLLMSLLVEAQYNRENHPKDILFTFGKELLKNINDKKAYRTVFDTLLSEWDKWEVLIASRDDSIDSFLAKYRKKLPWECKDTSLASAEVKTGICPSNWAYPVWTSVSGNKSDRYIERTYTSELIPLWKCAYENKITLINKNTYTKEDGKNITQIMDMIGIKEKEEREKHLFIQGNGKNKAFVRLYTPLGSTLAYSGSDITVSNNEFSTVFSFSIDTLPASTSSKTLRYRVDIQNCETKDTKLHFYKQPGLRKLNYE
jgi:hypothetical protein